MIVVSLFEVLLSVSQGKAESHSEHSQVFIQLS